MKTQWLAITWTQFCNEIQGKQFKEEISAQFGEGIGDDYKEGAVILVFTDGTRVRIASKMHYYGGETPPDVEEPQVELAVVDG